MELHFVLLGLLSVFKVGLFLRVGFLQSRVLKGGVWPDHIQVGIGELVEQVLLKGRVSGGFLSQMVGVGNLPQNARGFESFQQQLLILVEIILLYSS